MSELNNEQEFTMSLYKAEVNGEISPVTHRSLTAMKSILRFMPSIMDGEHVILQPPADGGPCNPLMLLYLVLNETFDFQTQESSEDLTLSLL